MPLHLDDKSKPGPLGMDWQRVALAHEKRVSDLEGELRGVIHEMEHIIQECRLGRDWKRVELLADNVHTVLRNKLVSK